MSQACFEGVVKFEGVVLGKPLLVDEFSVSIENGIFQGKVLNKYGTYMLQNVSYRKCLKVDLVGRESYGTITIHIDEIY